MQQMSKYKSWAAYWIFSIKFVNILHNLLCKGLQSYTYKDSSMQANPLNTYCYSVSHKSQLVSLVGFYVDDFTITGTLDFIGSIPEYLKGINTIKYTNKPDSFLGHQIQYVGVSIVLHQPDCITRVINTLNWTDWIEQRPISHPASIPQDWVDQKLADTPYDKRAIAVNPKCHGVHA